MNKLKNIMVCVTQQKTCERLITTGYKKIEQEKDNLFVIHVVNENDSFLHNSNEGEALEYLFAVSKKAGADLTVIRAKDVIGAIGDFAKKNEITHVILGESPNKDTDNHPIAKRLKKIIPNSEYIIV
ncbi:universal stress protein domain-containing protein [Gottschalkia acidurici 9a]|uniref:Universal stress protein domain-containing protein n=1 Tax=Gottschalkia acidurici (strain ATCC 7906 / DSM 604 / BCRC 14475 / CIP 104303 / KCTC 5404 / NCIMB 10678 / 9a) TaxID=1128398 RepID=K0B1Z1_GOTA9|nr:universal stress protein [Gottschalkia acidurici]AFS78935.1 universal stress protein domain-containing protein [Gottschalkia acidurici 9a]